MQGQGQASPQPHQLAWQKKGRVHAPLLRVTLRPAVIQRAHSLAYHAHSSSLPMPRRAHRGPPSSFLLAEPNSKAFPPAISRAPLTALFLGCNGGRIAHPKPEAALELQHLASQAHC
jgi:hypothetical protein